MKKNFQSKKKETLDLPGDHPSGGAIILVDVVRVVISESASIPERIATAGTLPVDFALGRLGALALVKIILGAVSLVGVRRRKLTRLRND